MRRDELEKHPRSHLIDLIQQHNIKGYSKLNKTQLVDLIIKNKSKIDFSKLLPTPAEQKELKKFLKEQDKKDAMKKAKEAKEKPKKKKKEEFSIEDIKEAQARIDKRERERRKRLTPAQRKAEDDKKKKEKEDYIAFLETLTESPPPSPKPKKKRMLFVRPKITEGEKKGDFQTAKEMTAVKPTPKTTPKKKPKKKAKPVQEKETMTAYDLALQLPPEVREIIGQDIDVREAIFETRLKNNLFAFEGIKYTEYWDRIADKIHNDAGDWWNNTIKNWIFDGYNKEKRDLLYSKKEKYNGLFNMKKKYQKRLEPFYTKNDRNYPQPIKSPEKYYDLVLEVFDIFDDIKLKRERIKLLKKRTLNYFFRDNEDIERRLNIIETAVKYGFNDKLTQDPVIKEYYRIAEKKEKKREKVLTPYRFMSRNTLNDFKQLYKNQEWDDDYIREIIADILSEIPNPDYNMGSRGDRMNEAQKILSRARGNRQERMIILLTELTKNYFNKAFSLKNLDGTLDGRAPSVINFKKLYPTAKVIPTWTNDSYFNELATKSTWNKEVITGAGLGSLEESLIDKDNIEKGEIPILSDDYWKYAFADDPGNLRSTPKQPLLMSIYDWEKYFNNSGNIPRDTIIKILEEPTITI